MNSRSSNFTSEELNLMISALERDLDLISNVLGRTIKDRKEQTERWQAVADLMNAVGRGTERNGQQVRRKWNELKNATKRTAAELRNDVTKTGGGEPNYELYLSPLELRILQLLGRSSYEGCTGSDFDLAAAKNSLPITTSQHASKQSIPQPSTTPLLCIPQPSTSTQSPYFSQPLTSTPSSYIPQPSTPTSHIPQSSTPSSCIPQPAFRNISISSEYNGLGTEADDPMPEDNDRGSYSDINKENECSWVFGSKNQSESSGTVRKRNSRGKKRKIFDESDTEVKVIETQDEIKNCLLAIKNMTETQIENQEKLLNVLQDMSLNQGLLLNKLDDIVCGQNNIYVLLQAISGYQVVNE